MLGVAFKKIFFWLPKAVHWLVVFSPLAIVFAFNEIVGPEFAAVCVIGAALYLSRTMLTPYNDYKNALSTAVLTTKGKKGMAKRVAVIGSGPAGLVTAKECLEAGHKVTTYDSAEKVGGEFANRFWPGGKLTSSPYVTCFSDFEPKHLECGNPNWLHKTKEEYVEYLEEYATHFKVTDTLHLQEAVTKVSMKKLPDEEPTFNITVESWKDGKKTTRTDGPYDHVAFCIGGNRDVYIPNVPGLEEFKKLGGDVFHSADFGEKKSVSEAFSWCANKRIVGLGMGESMADIYGILLDEMPVPPKDCYVAIRSGSWVIPRVNPLNGLVNDWDSTRLRYAMPKWAHNFAVTMCGFLNDYFALSDNKERSLRYKLMTTIPGAKPVYKPATKSNRFISVIAREKAKLLHAGIEKFEGKTVYFTDGTVLKDVDSVIFGTGFQKYDPFATNMKFEGGAAPDICPCGRYLRVFDPCFGSTVGFIGMGIRPLVGSIPTVAEIQARVFAAVVSGERVLPPTDLMIDRINVDRELSFKEFGPDNQNALSSSNGWKSVTNWIPFMDTCAREIGANPSPWWLLFRPFLALKIMYGPMSVMHYRMRGIGAKPDVAKRVIKKLPIGTRIADMMFYTSIHWSLALIKWPLMVISPGTYNIVNTARWLRPKFSASVKKTTCCD